jgi:sugar lactone lactonase YvrE
MKLSNITHPARPVLHSLVFTLLVLGVNAQDITQDTPSVTTDIPHVTWMVQWPASDKKQRPHGFKAQFNALFLGKKSPVLTRPVSVLAVDPGNFWILDQGTRAGFHFNGKLGDIPHCFLHSEFEFNSLVGICSDPDACIFFTDSHANKIYRILPGKKKIEILNDSLVLQQPTGIAFSPETNEIWVVETNAHRITVLDERGKIIRQFGSRGTAPGQFNYPTHIWIDRSGLVYVVDAMNFRVQVMDHSGEVVSVFGKQGDASGFFARPKGIATDSHGNIYIVDGLFHVVQVFDIKGKYLNSIGTQGQGEGEFWMPSGLFIDKDDHLYVADSYNARVQVFKLDYTTK